MTTAHRATWKAARGGLQEEGSFQLHVPSAARSSKDAPTERMLKLRPDDDVSRGELRARLEGPDAPGAHPEEPFAKRRRSRFGPAQTDRAFLTQGESHPVSTGAPDDAGAPAHGDGTPDDCAAHVDGDGAPGDAACVKEGVGDDALDEIEAGGASTGRVDEEASDGSASSSESESEDEAELIAEVERIRKEREFKRAKKDAEEQERLQEEARRVASDNPLLGNLAGGLQDDISDTASLATGGSVMFSVRRRWDDDVVFRNQAGEERAPSRRMINDTIRNDYHRRFMKRYMR